MAKKIQLAVGVTLIVLGLTIWGVSIFAPVWLTERFYEAKDAAVSMSIEVSKNTQTDDSGNEWGVFTEENGWSWIPSVVRLGGGSDHQSIDDCDNTFTHMLDYPESIPPWWSAHNGCGGDTILSLEPGDLLNLKQPNGKWEVWEVAEYKQVPQIGSTTDDVDGIAGEMILQTCYWDNKTMKILGIQKVSS